MKLLTNTLHFYMRFCPFHFLFENTHQHLHHFFHMHIDFIWNMCTCGWLCAYCKSKPFYSSAHFIWNFILISSCLISISQFALTKQYFVRAGGVLNFVGTLSEGLCSLFRRRFSVIFWDNRHNNSFVLWQMLAHCILYGDSFLWVFFICGLCWILCCLKRC